MPSNSIAYLDYNATAPVRDGVVDAMSEALSRTGNPSSVHRAGRIARRAIEDAREAVAALAGAAPSAVTFASGGTEANNLALNYAGQNALLVSSIEHPSVLEGGGQELSLLPVGYNGKVDVAGAGEMIRAAEPGTLVSVMLANNETGVLQPVPEIVEIAHSRGLTVHCDAVQAAGKIPIHMDDLGVDMLTLSAHKIGGPQGVGALIVTDRVDVTPMVKGGGQEKGRRGGTENVPGIVGFGVAAQHAVQEAQETAPVADLRNRLEQRVQEIAPATAVIGGTVERLPNTSCLTMPGVDSDVQVMAFDLAGVLVSAGSACSSGKVGSSHVLEAMGIEPDIARTAIRVSFGVDNTSEDLDRIVEAWTQLYRRAAQNSGDQRVTAS